MSGTLVIWGALAIISVVIEMLSRTFTMLAVAIGCGVAALMSWMGFGFILELVGAVLVSAICMLFLRKTEAGKRLTEAEESRFSVMDNNSDEVHVSQWDDGNSVDISFKGHSWKAELAPGSKARRGQYKIKEVREGKLILEEAPEPPPRNSRL